MNAFSFTKRISIILLVIVSSCASRQEIAYFQDEKIGEFTQPIIIPELIYQPNDMLTIDVSGLDPDAVRPFNLPAVSYDASSVLNAQASLRMQTYIIDRDGKIEFPVLGKVKLAGLTREQATTLLKSKITEYVKNPIVNIRLANFNITVLGEVNNPGTFTIQDERVTLTEALGLAGDLTIYGKRHNILLIREIDGIKKFSIIDLTTVKALTSGTFNLMQNDILYVEPNKARVRSSTFNQNNSVVISAVATLATIVAILIR